MRFMFVKEQRFDFPVEKMCQLLDVSRSGYYKWLKGEKSQRETENDVLLVKIKKIFVENHELYGRPRVCAELKSQGYHYNKKRIERLMKGKFVAKTRRKFKVTTDSQHSLPVAPNILKQNFVSEVANRVWTSDITYIWTLEGWLYLAVVLDVFSRKIVGWSMGKRLESQLVVNAIKGAILRRQPEPNTIFHSDRGIQYAAKDTRLLLKSHGFIQSMSRKGRCYDNAITESFFHSLKTEQVYFERYTTRKEARQSIFNYIEVFYNRQRRHSSIGFLSPDNFEKKFVNA